MHIPVLLKEVLQFLAPQPNENFIDATIGEGGHSFAILKQTAPQGKILGIEWDEILLRRLQQQLKESSSLENRLILREGNFAQVDKIAREVHFQQVQGILFDLGMNSWHLDESGKGFSFRKDEPLDMRFSSKNNLTAAEIVNSWPREKIAVILREFGEERYSQQIAKAICQKRKKERILLTSQLRDILKEVLPENYKHQRLHFATRTFQALRITVNRELENIEQGLEKSLALLAPGGRIVVISFHSLEDRITKHFFQQKAREKRLEILTKKPICSSLKEREENPRSRSAKLRAAKII